MFLWKPWFQDPVMNRKFKRTVYVWNINLCNIINVFTVTFDLSFKSINLCPKIVLNSNARKKFCIIRPLILTFVVCHIKNNSVFSDYLTKLFSLVGFAAVSFWTSRGSSRFTPATFTTLSTYSLCLPSCSFTWEPSRTPSPSEACWETPQTTCRFDASRLLLFVLN